MRRNRWFLVIFAIYLIGFSGHALYLKKTVYGDGAFYFSWLRSAVVDRDTDFRNEFARLGSTQPETPKGTPGNKYSVGPAVLWLPWYLWARQLLGGDGYGFGYQFAIGISSVLYTIVGLVLLYLLLAKSFSRLVAALATLAITFATNLLFYGSLDPVNSHSISFFAATVFLSALLTQKSPLLIGFTLGLLGSVRTNDLVYGILLLPLMSKKTIVPVATGVILGFTPQLLAWQALYDTFLTSPYLTGGEGFDLTHPHILEVLFSPRNGLFLWTPLLILGFIGLLLANRNVILERSRQRRESDRIPSKYRDAIPANWRVQHDRNRVSPINNIYYESKTRGRFSFQKLALLTLMLQIFIVSSWSTWWQGASYSGRMFVSILPLFAYGIAAIFERLQELGWKYPQFLLALIGPLSLVNFMFILFFLLRQ